MKATLSSDSGAIVSDIPVPTVGARDVLVKVHAAGLNRADLSVLAGQRHGAASGPGTPLGLEWSGEVAAIGSAVRHVKEGDRVMCSGRGGLAEYALTDLGRVMPIPRNDMSFEQAAGLPIALQTMHDAVITHGQLQPGQSILVQGASAGVGLMALQIAKWRGASVVIGTSTDATRRQRLTAMGADLALDSRDPAWVQQVLQATEYVTPAIEIIDSRIEQFDRHTKVMRKVFDTISDNAANAGIVLGAKRVDPLTTDLPWCGAILRQNGVVEETGLAAGVQGHPAVGIAWLANKLAPWGEHLQAGEIVLAGSFTKPAPAKVGDVFDADYGPLGQLQFRFV